MPLICTSTNIVVKYCIANIDVYTEMFDNSNKTRKLILVFNKKSKSGLVCEFIRIHSIRIFADKSKKDRSRAKKMIASLFVRTGDFAIIVLSDKSCVTVDRYVKHCLSNALESFKDQH